MSPDTPLTTAFPRLSEKQQKALRRLKLETVRDLLYHFPARYSTVAHIRTIDSLAEGEQAVLYGTIAGLKTKKGYRSKIPMAEGTLSDDTGTIKLVWFNQPYIAKMLKDKQAVKLEGKIERRNGNLYIANPEYEKLPMLPTAVGDSLFSEDNEFGFSIPIYPESRGITSKWFFHAIQKLIKGGMLEELDDPIPSHILKKYHLPELKNALIWIHIPRKIPDAEAAKKRFAFEEVFGIQLYKQQQKARYAEEESFLIPADLDTVSPFLKRFDFTPTNAQLKAIKEILKDMSTPTPMSRLLEGDVGSGKTLVAAATSYAVVTTPPKGQHYGNLQVAYMAPTEILARQHFDSFTNYFSHLPIQIGLITGSGCMKFPSKVAPTKATTISRSQLLKWVANGEIAILLGTHALIQKSVKFKHLACIVIDEQHRFGVNQRKKLAGKEKLLPHLLSMTATPIPRTLALTIYGDLDLTVLDEVPAGRKPITTELVPPEKREEIYERIKEELAAGRQAYVICPRIDEPDPGKEQAVIAKSVKEEARRLNSKIFTKWNVEALHGKMTPKEKDDVMRRFAEHKIDILVATSVVEVGVNVPNATMIIIEGAERFGLAQLHQLRGRVQRSTHQAYCFVFTDSTTEKTLERLKALQSAKTGFELAEYDLSIRGTGELIGTRQSGISDIGMEAIRNIKMVEAARNEAQEIIHHDPALENFPLLAKKVKTQEQRAHFE